MFCPICQSNIILENDKCITKCNHSFHTSCFILHTRKSLNCPICRKLLNEEEENTNEDNNNEENTNEENTNEENTNEENNYNFFKNEQEFIIEIENDIINYNSLFLQHYKLSEFFKYILEVIISEPNSLLNKEFVVRCLKVMSKETENIFFKTIFTNHKCLIITQFINNILKSILENKKEEYINLCEKYYLSENYIDNDYLKYFLFKIKFVFNY